MIFIEELEATKTKILADQKRFVSGFIHKKRDQDRSAITDSNTAYFILEVDEDSFTATPFEGTGSRSYLIRQDISLIARLENADKSDLVLGLIAILSDPELNYNVKLGMGDAEEVHLEETGETLQQKMNLVKIVFELRKVVDSATLTKCKNKLCVI